MDAEKYLRDRARQRLVGFQDASDEMRAEAHRSAFGYFAGAVDALVETGDLSLQRSSELMDELLRPMTEPLVASGQLTPVTARAEARTELRFHQDRRRSLLSAVAQLQELDLLKSDEAETIRRRIEEHPPTEE